MRIYYAEDGSKTHGTIVGIDYGPTWADPDPTIFIEWDDEKGKSDPYSKEDLTSFQIVKEEESKR